jgi:hypothetical protein
VSAEQKLKYNASFRLFLRCADLRLLNIDLMILSVLKTWLTNGQQFFLFDIYPQENLSYE